MSRYIMDQRRTVSPESALASDIFDKFCSANTLKGILSQYRQLCSVLRIKPTHFPEFYPRLKAKLSSWRAQGLWSKFEKRASQKCYGRGKACYGTRVLIIGAGPCGLRAAIEAQLLGAKVVLVEKRDRFSRNNVLHLWPFVITDLKALGAKKFYGKFCAGSIDHISIRQLQCILLKVALLLGVEVHEGVGFEGLIEPADNEGWRTATSPADHPVSHYNFDVLIGADGRRNTLEGFKRKALRAKLAIAITANFINKHTEPEARVKEISGVSYIFNQKFFQDLCEATGIDLENIVYYKDETHYFVMTAKKQSLLNKGVLLQDYADTAKLLSHENISSEALMLYALEAAMFATEYQLPDIEFAVNHYGQPDVAMFDFTAMYAAENACRVIQRKGHKLLMTLVGDSLLEPFWPTGSGCARGFLSSFDASWMLRSWTGGVKSVLEVVAERESIYRLLGQTTPENLQKEHVAYSIDPHSRYPNLNLRLVMPFQVKSLYESDEPIQDVIDSASDIPIDNEKVPKKRRRDSVIAVDSLINWLRDQVSCYSLEINDVRDAFVCGDVLCAIVHRFRPDLIDYPLPSEENVDPLIAAAFSNQLAFDIFHQEYGLPHAMSGFESVQFVSSDFLTFIAYLSQVYEIFRGEIPQTKYLRSESGDELDDNQQEPNHIQALKELRMAVTAKHHFTQKSISRRSRMSSSKEGESEPYRRHKKRRSEEKSRAGSSSDMNFGSSELQLAKKGTKDIRKINNLSLDAERFMRSMRLLQMSQGQDSDDEEDENEGFHDASFYLYRQTVPDFDERCKFLEQKLSGRGMKTTFGKSLADSDCEKMVPGLAKDLEAKLKGRSSNDRQKPKDMIRAIGKIEKSDWNVQLIEKKIAEVKNAAPGKKDKDNKVPRWSREAFDDKREAMKRKMDGADKDATKDQLFEETMKKLGSKLKEGNTLDVGQRGSNKVSAMAEQLIHKLEKDISVPKQTTARPTFEMPKKGRIDLCHFCKERVYVVERMTAEGKYFHRNCFRCEYCNTSLRIGNYVFDREGRYGERFYCAAHYSTVKMYGWKKFDTSRPEDCTGEKLVPPASQQILADMDERGTTPERAEFENSVDFASEEELLNEMDEDEWTDRNFGASEIADNTSDEASDLSDDEEVTPDGNKDVKNAKFPVVAIESVKQEVVDPVKKDTESSDSDTEVASDDEDEEDGSGEYEEEAQEEEEDEDDEYEEECGGSTTEIETDSEFAEDPPHSVPGSIPTIIVNAPEQLVTKLVDAIPINHTHRSQPSKDSKTSENVGYRGHQQRKILDMYKSKDFGGDKSIEIVKKGAPERQLPIVTGVPKKWEPSFFNNADRLASKVSIDLKNKYLHGNTAIPTGINQKKSTDPAAQSQFRTVLDMISEQQKLLQPAAKPSASMQAFLDGAEKLKNKTNLPHLNRNLTSIHTNNLNTSSSPQDKPSPLIENSIPEVPGDDSHPNENGNSVTQSTGQSSNKSSNKEDVTFSTKSNKIQDDSLENEVSQIKLKEIKDEMSKDTFLNKGNMDFTPSTNTDNDVDEMNPSEIKEDDFNVMITSDTFSTSQSETDTRSTVINVLGTDVKEHTSDSGSDTEVGSGEPSDLDDMDFDPDPPHIIREPPRVEIEDEFGVTQSLDIVPEKGKHSGVINVEKESKYIMDLGLSESRDKSSSDSSLNSGIFLETEMSEYAKEECGGDQIKSQNKNSKIHSKRKDRIKKVIITENVDTISKTKQNLGFDLEALDFADIDGISSPEDGSFDPAQNIQRLDDFDSHKSNVIATPNFSKSENNSNPRDLDPRSKVEESRSTSTTTESPSDDDDDTSEKETQEDHSTSTEADLSENINFSTTDKVPELSKTSTLKFDKSKESFPLLERVGPFSSARDSLDYRKIKAVTSHLRNNELYSTYAVPSVKVGSSTKQIPWEEESKRLENIGEATSLEYPSINMLSGEKSIGSPGTTRKINEIHQERVKQNDLIRSMVLGRIKRSPDKVIRRNSKGSSSGTSLHSQTTVEKSGDESDSRKSSDNSQGQDDNTSEEYVDEVKRKSYGENIDADVEHSSFDDSSANIDIPHRPMAESVSSNSDHSSTSRSAKILLTPQNIHPTYEPVFTSSPRFRNRPKFDGKLTTYQSITEPPTPTESEQPSYLNAAGMKDEKAKGIYSVANPLFFRSMPNLAQTMASGKHSKFDVMTHMENSVFQSSQNSKKVSPHNEISLSSLLSKRNYAEDYQKKPEVFVERLSQNVISPGQNLDPFLVESCKLAENEHKINTQMYEPTRGEMKNEPRDDFINLHLRFRTGDRPSERKISPEKARSVCTESLRNYGDSGSPINPIPLSTQYNSGSRYPATDNWILEKQENIGRPRANTLADLHFKESPNLPIAHRASVSFIDERNSQYPTKSSRHSDDKYDSSSKPARSKALSSDTLLDPSPLSENSCRGTSVPDISRTVGNREPSKERKGKDRDRRRSLIQAVSDFFTIRGTTLNPTDKSPSSAGQSLTTSASSSSIVSPTKDKFSLFKLTPKLLQTKEKKNSSKSRECVISPSSHPSTSNSKYPIEGFGDNGAKGKTDFSAYFVQPNVIIQRLSSSPNPTKPERMISSQGEKRHSTSDYNAFTQNMGALSIVPGRGKSRSDNRGQVDYRKSEGKRSREIEEIQLQLDSIDADQRVLEARGVKIEKKLRGEEPDEENRGDNEIMEEWFALVREKTRLARFEKELIVRAQELELESRKCQLEEQLDKSLSISESEKTTQEKQQEIEILHELRRIDEQHGNLIYSIHADMEKYKSEDSMTPPGSSRLESDV